MKKIWMILFIIACFCRSIVVIFLNRGYAKLIDNILKGSSGVIGTSAVVLLCTGAIQVAVILFQSLIASLLAEKVGCDLRTKAIEGILKTEFKTIYGDKVRKVQ